MIGVFFVAGTFGSTVDAALNYSSDIEPCALGTSHVRHKIGHTVEDIMSAKVATELDQSICVAPFWPWETQQLPAVITSVTSVVNLDHTVIIYCSSFDNAELNLLFQLHKIPNNKEIPADRGLHCICGDNLANIRMWNPEYNHWSDMKRWELREWLHFFYPRFVEEWTAPAVQLKNTGYPALFVSSTDILYAAHKTVNTIAQYCNVELHADVADYLLKWQAANQYIVNEYQLTKDIIASVSDNTSISWQPLNIIQEAIVQYRLTEIGYKLRCRELELDVFPQTTADLIAACEKM